jgi:hypothetical protein
VARRPKSFRSDTPPDIPGAVRATQAHVYSDAAQWSEKYYASPNWIPSGRGSSNRSVGNVQRWASYCDSAVRTSPGRCRQRSCVAVGSHRACPTCASLRRRFLASCPNGEFEVENPSGTAAVSSAIEQTMNPLKAGAQAFAAKLTNSGHFNNWMMRTGASKGTTVPLSSLFGAAAAASIRDNE